MKWRLPWAARIGIALALIGIIAPLAWNHWMNTRTWVPLDIPLSLSPGQVSTGEFQTNVESDYLIYMVAEQKRDDEGTPCLMEWAECVKTLPTLQASWSLSSHGKVVAQGRSGSNHEPWAQDDTAGRAIGRFHAERGRHYVLTVDILKDSNRLNAASPRLQLRASWVDYAEYEYFGGPISFGAMIFCVAGLLLLIRSLLAQRASRHWKIITLAEFGPQPGKLYFEPGQPQPEPAGRDRRVWVTLWLTVRLAVLGVVVCFASTFSLAAFCFAVFASLLIFFASEQIGKRPTQISIFGPPKPGGPHFQWAQKLPLQRKFCEVPSFGLITISACFVVLVPLWLMQPLPHKGLVIHVIKPGPVIPTGDAAPLIVRLKASRSGKPPTLYLQSKPVSMSSFSSALKDELRVRRDWTVYFQGDQDLDWKDAIQVMDIIRGTPAKIVLLTPQTQRLVSVR